MNSIETVTAEIQPVSVVLWEPTEVTMEQHHIIAYLCKYEKILLTRINSELNRFGLEADMESFVEELIDTGLVGIDGRKYLRLLTVECKACIMNGRFYAADDKSGRFTRWVRKQMKK